MLWELSTDQWIMSFSFVCCTAYICGWFSNTILGYSGFGALGNWIVLMIGCYAGLYLYNVYGYRFNYNPTLTISVAFGSALAMLMLMASVKAVIRA